MDESNQNFKKKIEGTVPKNNNSQKSLNTSKQNFDQKNSTINSLSNIGNNSIGSDQMISISTSSSASFELTGLSNKFGLDDKPIKESYPLATSTTDFDSSKKVNNGNSYQVKEAPTPENDKNLSNYKDSKQHETSIETPLRVFNEEDFRDHGEGKVM